MNLQQRAEKIAREVVSTAAVPFSVADTRLRQDKIIALAARLVLPELKALLDETHVKFEP